MSLEHLIVLKSKEVLKKKMKVTVLKEGFKWRAQVCENTYGHKQHRFVCVWRTTGMQRGEEENQSPSVILQ